MRLLLLGAGYVGKALLKNSPHSFLAATTSKDRLQELSSLSAGSLLIGKDKRPLQEALDKVDGVIILIAPKENSLESYQNTYIKMAKTLSLLLEKRKKNFYLLQASSTGVYQKSPKANILLETESIYQNCASTLVSVCTLRLGGIYGPGRELVKRAQSLSGRKLPGSGEEPTNHVHLDDIVSSIHFCLSKKLEGVFNLVNEEHRSRKKLYDALCSSLGIPSPSFDSSKKMEHGSHEKITGEKIKKTGFTFTHPLCDVPN